MPIDPKTGYKHEPWHLRFVGADSASQMRDAWTASGPGTPQEITLEQWLRARKGLPGDALLPVCDGCACGACATMAADGDKTPCGEASLQLDDAGRAAAPSEAPRIVDASIDAAQGGAVVVSIQVHAPAHTPTQTPVTTEAEPTYGGDASVAALVPYAGTAAHRYDDLPQAWRVAIEPVPPLPARWPWRASLARPELEATWNRANLLLPARPGDSTVRVRVVLPEGATGVRVALWRSGVEIGTREVSLR